jgi:hypothetical protein
MKIFKERQQIIYPDHISKHVNQSNSVGDGPIKLNIKENPEIKTVTENIPSKTFRKRNVAH